MAVLEFDGHLYEARFCEKLRCEVCSKCRDTKCGVYVASAINNLMPPSLSLMFRSIVRRSTPYFSAV
jgi:hypothetical protein